MSYDIPSDMVRIGTSFEEYELLQDLKERKLFLMHEIEPLDYENGPDEFLSTTGRMVRFICQCNLEDKGMPREDRKPIKIYIDSPGGDIDEGFSLISAIELSKTPVYTINIGQWSSMSFLIGITGHKRLSLPYSTFLLHEGSSFAGGATNKVQDRVEFEKRVENEVVKPHVLKYSKMNSVEYDALTRVEYYMLPKDALEQGFIDEIVSDIDAIL